MAILESIVASTKSHQPLVLRSAHSGDAEAIFRLTREVIAEDDFIVSTSEEYASSVEDELHWIQDTAIHPSNLILVAELDNRVVGFLNFQIQNRERKSHCGHFHMLIARDFRNFGIGSALVSTLTSWAESQSHIEKLSFAVFSSNHQAIHVYKKFGFQEEARKPREIKLGFEQYVDEIHMFRFVDQRIPLTADRGPQ